jgi:hypothetical protein
VYGHVLILAGGEGYTDYVCALAPVRHEKVSLFFLVPEANVVRERGSRKFGGVNSLIEPQGSNTLRTTKIIVEGIERC